MGLERMNRGVIYIGHLPHGFYERELRGFFSQFGKVTKLRVCRSKKTGHSKGYGFIEFECDEVAKIAAETMNNYLLFEKLLKCYRIPPEEVPVDVFKGFRTNSNLNFMKQRRLHNSTKTSEQDEKRFLRAKKKLEKLRGKLAELGIKYSFNSVERPVREPVVAKSTVDTTSLVKTRHDVSLTQPLQIQQTWVKKSAKDLIFGKAIGEGSFSILNKTLKGKSLGTVAEQAETEASPVTFAEKTEKKASPLIVTPKYKAKRVSFSKDMNEENTSDNVEAPIIEIDAPIPSPIVDKTPKKRSPKEHSCKRKSLGTVAQQVETEASPVTFAEKTKRKASPLIVTPNYKTKQHIKSGVCSTSRKAMVKALAMRKRSPKERRCKLNKSLL